MAKTIILTGTFCHVNKGDAAMQSTMASLLEQKYEECEVVISAPFPYEDRPFYAPRQVIRCHRRRLIYSAFQCLSGWLWKKTGRVGWLLDEEMRYYAKADLIVDLSGDMLTEDYGSHVALSHFYPILLANAMGKRVFLCAQSIGPFNWTRKLASYVLNHAGAVTVRDQVTLDYLQSIGVMPRRLGLTADLAFLMEPEDVQIGRDRLLRLVGDSQGPLLGVSLSFLIEKHYLKKCPVSHQESFVELMARSLDAWVERYQGVVVFFAHVTGPGELKDDREACRRVVQHMKHSAFVLEEDLSPAVIKGTIRHCDLFFGARMHANIAALSSYVPTIAISYSHKTPGIMNQLGCGEFVLPIEALSDRLIESAFMRMHAEREDVRLRLHQRVPEVRSLASRNMGRVDALLDLD
ncbi:MULTISPECIES: polysaccharide pyruvyl transferase family protein [unclassified Lentimonas]|uniref:polysaccharide pyruvyl transferase family protein n=1 Tax=unclassified Lentimonas TaxID=2630993 RepID=UPI0013259272|nr:MULTISPECIES: polysaccharide pyruvyl transferase family protein [unclassified Lentimonas]CAA6691136.1 Unannotated [Lentimonas sp. CC10]CAA6693760.1 Unannotated [Lentimonas sp. CC19]CAA7070130.1 Unannotated [Lentimonas sp. CC11]